MSRPSEKDRGRGGWPALAGKWPECGRNARNLTGSMSRRQGWPARPANGPRGPQVALAVNLFSMPAKPKSSAKPAKGKTVATFRDDAKCKNLPTVEYQS